MFVNIVKSLLQMFSKNRLIQDLAVIPDLFFFFILSLKNVLYDIITGLN